MQWCTASALTLEAKVIISTIKPGHHTIRLIRDGEKGEREIIYLSLHYPTTRAQELCENNWRWTSRAPVPNKPTVSVDVKQHFSMSAPE